METNWFFINSDLLQIYIFGKGNRPAKTYSFEDKKEFKNKIKEFKQGGYQFIKDKAKK
jgi:hypothetical protein